MKRGESVWLHRFAMLTAATTFVLLIAGALVVGHDAGLAVPDWPLSFGTWMPRMEGGVFYEHGHRLIAALVGTLTTVLAVWLWRVEERRWVRLLGVVAVIAVITQAVLGGITVLYLLPIPILILHACLAQLFFCLTVSLALFTAPSWKSAEVSEDLGSPAFRHLAAVTTVAIFIQLVLGAARRHDALGLLPHVLWAGVVTALVLWLVYIAMHRLPRSQKAVQTLSYLAGMLLAAQLILGFGSYWTRLVSQGAPQPQAMMIHVTTAHVAVGAALLGTMVLATLLAYHRLRAPGEVLSFGSSPQKTLA